MNQSFGNDSSDNETCEFNEYHSMENRCFMVVQLQNGQMGYYWLDHITETGMAKFIEVSDSIQHQNLPDDLVKIIDVKNMIVVQQGL